MIVRINFEGDEISSIKEIVLTNSNSNIKWENTYLDKGYYIDWSYNNFCAIYVDTESKSNLPFYLNLMKELTSFKRNEKINKLL